MNNGKPIDYNRVVFDIINEPFDDLINPAVAGNRLQGLDSQLGNITPQQWWGNQRTAFRAIVKSAINALHSTIPNAHVIAPFWVALPSGTYHWNSSHTEPNPYSFLEVAGYQNIIYTWHFYEPIFFTHRPAIGGAYFDRRYGVERDWLGLNERFNPPSSLTPASLWDPQSTSIDAPYDSDRLGDNPSSLHFLQPVPTVYLEPESNQTQQYVKDVIVLMDSWRSNAQNLLGFYPKVLIGEFGCERRNVPLGTGHDDILPTPLSPPQTDEQMNYERADWLWDARTAFEKMQNTGWTVFSYADPYFGSFSGNLHTESSHNVHGERGYLYEYVRKALFEATRP